MNETYAAPQSELVAPSRNTQTIDDALAGNYNINIANIMSESWQKTKGVKRYILGAAIIMYVALFVVMMALGVTLVPAGQPTAMHLVAQVIMQLAVMAIILPFVAGIFVISAKRVNDAPFEFGDAFSAFGKTVPLLVASVLMNVLVTLGFLLLIVPGIYLAFAYMLTVPLIVDRDMGAWQALETSRKAISKHWFSFFVLWIVMILILAISMIPFGLGLIWTIPMLSVAFAITYREVFGIETL